MRTRITSNPNHLIGKAIAGCWPNVDFFSRASNWNIMSQDDINKFVAETKDYDWTINFCIGHGFHAVNLFLKIQEFCEHNKYHHKILNIGSYMGYAIIHNPCGSYDIEKATLKHVNKRAAFSKSFKNTFLDSRIINFGYLERNGGVMELPHINLLPVEKVVQSVKFMLNNPSVKEMSVQYKQPGNHRINDGVGPILPSFF